MPTFEEAIAEQYEVRLTTLARIKARSFGTDTLTLTALGVLVYAQLEGGVKDLCMCVIKHVNLRSLTYRELRPSILQWRNTSELEKFKAELTFQSVADQSPFSTLLLQRPEIRQISRRHEMNQMDWGALSKVYTGLGLDLALVKHLEIIVEDIVATRNAAAHHGVLPVLASALIERQVRQNVAVVEDMLTDMAIQLLDYFPRQKHRR